MLLCLVIAHAFDDFCLNMLSGKFSRCSQVNAKAPAVKMTQLLYGRNSAITKKFMYITHIQVRLDM